MGDPLENFCCLGHDRVVSEPTPPKCVSVIWS